jgi:putative membrane protein
MVMGGPSVTYHRAAKPCYTVHTVTDSRNWEFAGLQKEIPGMWRMLIQWLLSAIAVMIISRTLPGITVNEFRPALVVALAIGFADAMLGYLLRMISFPFAIALFGVLLVFLNAALFMAASRYMDGFFVYGTNPALWAGGILTVLALILRLFMKDE